MRTISLDYGDLSADGHSITESINFSTDLTDDQIRDVWKNAIVEVGFDYLKKYNDYDDNISEKEKSDLDNYIVYLLKNPNMLDNPSDLIGYVAEYMDTHDDDDGDLLDDCSFEDVFELLMQRSMITLKLTSSTFKKSEDVFPTFNDILGKDYMYIGYGCFD
jgi:hypothetical protein